MAQGWWRPRKPVSSLDEHPNLTEILGIMAQVPRLSELDVAVLAHGWRDNTFIAGARDRALSPESPLVVDVLAAFDRVDAVFFDDLADGDAGPDADLADRSPRGLTPQLVSTALKAIRDALAAAYARPVLTRAEYGSLMAPWRRALDSGAVRAPAGIVTRAAAVEELLAAIGPLAARCHDTSARALFAKLADAARQRDEQECALARDTAFRSAVASARRRQWTLLRQAVADALSRPCVRCGGARGRDSEPADAGELVRALCSDAACAVLMADALQPATLQVLLNPAARLLPTPRTPAGE
jgi:hypothetical protein